MEKTTTFRLDPTPLWIRRRYNVVVKNDLAVFLQRSQGMPPANAFTRAKKPRSKSEAFVIYMICLISNIGLY